MTNKDPETFMFIPMAISLAFGVIFATVITMFLVPSLYLMLQDWLEFCGFVKLATIPRARLGVSKATQGWSGYQRSRSLVAAAEVSSRGRSL